MNKRLVARELLRIAKELLKEKDLKKNEVINTGYQRLYVKGWSGSFSVGDPAYYSYNGKIVYDEDDFEKVIYAYVRGWKMSPNERQQIEEKYHCKGEQAVRKYLLDPNNDLYVKFIVTDDMIR